MANCTQTFAGIQTDCNSNIGGVRSVYICPYLADLALDLNEQKEVTNIRSTSIPQFFLFRFRKGNASMTSNLTADATTGVSYVTTELSMTFSRMTTERKIEINNLCKGKVQCIVEDENGKFYFLGADSYVSASAGSAQTGAQRGDNNSLSITLKDESNEFPYLMTKSAVMSVMGVVDFYYHNLAEKGKE